LSIRVAACESRIVETGQKRSTALVTNVDFDKWGRLPGRRPVGDGPSRPVRLALILTMIAFSTKRTPLVKPKTIQPERRSCQLPL
jgi:hypothetical protein